MMTTVATARRAKQALYGLMALVIGASVLVGFSPRATAVAPAANERASIDVFVQGGAIVSPGSTVTVRISIRAAESQPLGEQAIRLSITESPVGSESQLRRFLNKEADVPLQVVETKLSPQVLELETSDVRIDLIVPIPMPETLPDEMTDDGEPSPAAIYGLQADFLESLDNPDAEPLLSQRQALIVIDPTNPVAPAKIAPIVPVILPPTGGQTLTDQELDSYTRSGGVLDTLVGTLERYPSTVAIDSRITLSIDALGDATPPSAATWRQKLQDLDAPLIALPWADADPLATLAIDTLLYGRIGQYPWPHSGLTRADIDVLSQRSAEAILVQSSAIDSDQTVVAFADTRMIRVDDLMSTFVAQVSLAASPDEAEAGLQRAQALIAQRAISGSGEVLVFHTGRVPVTASVIRLENILERLWAMELAETTTVPLSQPASERVLSVNETSPTQQWAQFIDDVRSLWETDVRYVSIADNPEDAILGRWNRYQALFSSAWLGNPTGLIAEWERAQEDSRAFRSSVHIEQGSAFTVLSDRTELPVVIRNDLRSTVRVKLLVQPQRGILRVENPLIDVVIPAQSAASVRIPVTSLASGTAPIALTLQSFSGDQISDPVDISVTIRAGWENVITGVLALVLGIVFAVGIYRAVQRRRTTKSVDGEDTKVDGDT
jgi:hypothetical protein